MHIYPGNNTGKEIDAMYKEYGGLKILNSLHSFKRPRYDGYSLDNGAFPSFTKKEEWQENQFLALLEKAKRYPEPDWVVCPDVVCDPLQTLQKWKVWAPKLKAEGFRVAFAMQDGHKYCDIPTDADWVFVGGSTLWKREKLKEIKQCVDGLPIHVGRINTGRWLWECYQSGIDSVDGTGWFRKGKQIEQLKDFLAYQAGKKPKYFQLSLF